MAIKRNKKLAESFQGKPCLVCGDTTTTHGHHIVSFGSRPDLDIKENIMPLCYQHHVEIHKGTTKFVNKYFLEWYMFDNGFWFDGNFNKWRIDLAEVLYKKCEILKRGLK